MSNNMNSILILQSSINNVASTVRHIISSAWKMSSIIYKPYSSYLTECLGDNCDIESHYSSHALEVFILFFNLTVRTDKAKRVKRFYSLLCLLLSYFTCPKPLRCIKYLLSFYKKPNKSIASLKYFYRFLLTFCRWLNFHYPFFNLKIAYFIDV